MLKYSLETRSCCAFFNNIIAAEQSSLIILKFNICYTIKKLENEKLTIIDKKTKKKILNQSNCSFLNKKAFISLYLSDCCTTRISWSSTRCRFIVSIWRCRTARKCCINLLCISIRRCCISRSRIIWTWLIWIQHIVRITIRIIIIFYF